MDISIGKNINNASILSIYNRHNDFGIAFNELGRFCTFTVGIEKKPKFFINTIAFGVGHRKFTLFWLQYIGGGKNRIIFEFLNSGEKILNLTK